MPRLNWYRHSFRNKLSSRQESISSERNITNKPWIWHHDMKYAASWVSSCSDSLCKLLTDACPRVTFCSLDSVPLSPVYSSMLISYACDILCRPTPEIISTVSLVTSIVCWQRIPRFHPPSSRHTQKWKKLGWVTRLKRRNYRIYYLNKDSISERIQVMRERQDSKSVYTCAK